MKCLLFAVIAVLTASLAAATMDVTYKMYVGPPTSPIAGGSVTLSLLNNSLVITGDGYSFLGLTSLGGAGVDTVNNILTWNSPSTNYHNIGIQCIGGLSDFGLSRLAVVYNQASGTCGAGAQVDLVKRLSPAGQDVIPVYKAFWQFRAGGYASSYTTIPVKVDVANCSLTSMTVTLVRADGTTVTSTQSSISVPYYADNTLVSLAFNMNVGSNNQIKAVRVETAGGECRMARVKVETQQTNSAPNYTCYYRAHPINIGIVRMVTNGYIYTNPKTWIQLSSTTGEGFEFKCVINSDFC